jgi:hypothetical protein
MSANLKNPQQFILVQNQTLTFMEASSSSSSSSTMYDVPTTLLDSFRNAFGHGGKRKIMADGVPNCPKIVVMVIAIWNLVMLKAPYVSEEEIIKVCAFCSTNSTVCLTSQKGLD